MTTQVYVAAVAAALLLGCAGSSSDTGTISRSSRTPQAEKIATTEQRATQAADSNTGLAAGNKANTVSAGNPIGKAQNIFALIQSTPNLSVLTKLIHAADMITVLESPAAYTFFAPSDEAFAALPDGAVEALMLGDNKLELTRMLQAHVLPERMMSYELKNNMQMQTAQGDNVTIQADDRGLVVGGARITIPDLKASNGVVHVIDRVLLPPQD